jgi:hypothetical protein
MSIRMTNMIFEFFVAKPDRKLLALKLADNADENGLRIFPSVETLARCCCCSERSVQRWLSELVSGGLIQRVKYINGGRGKACEYRINPDFINAHDPRVPQDQRPKWEFNCTDAQSDLLVSGSPQKGDSQSPFAKAKRVTGQTQKGDSAQSQKGDSAESPQLPLTVIEPNTPLPPDGGDAEKFRLDKLLASLIEAHGRHGTSDTTAARRELAKLAPNAASSERMLSDLKAEVTSNPQWQLNDGQYRCKLSKWLRGWRDSVAVGVMRTAPKPAPSAAEKTLREIAQSTANTKPPPSEIREQLRQLSMRIKGAASAGLITAKQKGS